MAVKQKQNKKKSSAQKYPQTEVNFFFFFLRRSSRSRQSGPGQQAGHPAHHHRRCPRQSHRLPGGSLHFPSPNWSFGLRPAEKRPKEGQRTRSFAPKASCHQGAGSTCFKAFRTLGRSSGSASTSLSARSKGNKFFHFSQVDISMFYENLPYPKARLRHQCQVRFLSCFTENGFSSQLLSCGNARASLPFQLTGDTGPISSTVIYFWTNLQCSVFKVN